MCVIWNNIQIQEISGTKQTKNKYRLGVPMDNLAFGNHLPNNPWDHFLFNSTVKTGTQVPRDELFPYSLANSCE